MLVKITLLDGSDALIQSERVSRMRDSHPQTTPNSVIIDFPPRRYSSCEDLATLRARFNPHMKLADLTTPIGTLVVINADLVESVYPAGPMHHPDAKAVISFTAGERELQQVQESVAETARILKAAD